jgi:hypothetical protein
MFGIFNLLIVQAALALPTSPIPLPVFLKSGFSSILEFDEAPTQVVLGDPNVFQVEKLEKAIVIKPLTAYATTNMFIYFKSKPTRLFILTASEEAEPTYYKNFTSVVPETKKPVAISAQAKFDRLSRVLKSTFDEKKDFLTVDFELSADSAGKVIPNWDLVRLKYKDRFMTASKLWSERREVQKDSKVHARAIFTKPNVPVDCRGVVLLIPLKDSPDTMTLQLGKVQR